MSGALALEVPFAIIPEWVLRAPISAQAVRTYGLLARYADKDKRAKPSHGRLAKDMDISVTTVRRALEELKQIRALVSEPRYLSNGDQTSNLYVLKHTPPVAPPYPSMDTPPSMGEQTPPPPVNNEREPSEREPRNEKELAPSAQELSTRRRDLLWEALEAEYGMAPVDRNLRNGWNTAAKELRAKGKTPEWVHERVLHGHNVAHGWAVCTPNALAKYADLPLLANRPYDRAAEIARPAMEAMRRVDDARPSADDRGLAPGRLAE